jgi:NCAIR mutase (PurE)-related protein
MIRFDLDRMARLGFGEAIFSEGKSLEDILFVIREVGNKQPLMFTRISSHRVEELTRCLPELKDEYIYNPVARVLRKRQDVDSTVDFCVAVVSAGTCDQGVLEEAVETLNHHRVSSKVFGDVGVAGIHRLFEVKDQIAASDCVICVAGMDAALASVVSGLFPQPVIGVPTSVGYGVSKDGMSALYSMLSSCANGLTVMNIDNGYGAAMAAIRIKALVGRKNGG